MRPSHLRAALTAVLPLVAAAACVHTVVPRAAPEQVLPVDPPIPRRALLLLTPSFAEFVASHTTEGPPFDERADFQIGLTTSRLLEGWVSRSFASAEVRRLSESDALRTFVTGDGAAGGEVLLLPRFEYRGEPYEGSPSGARHLVTRLRVDARSLPTGAARSWLVVGNSRGAGFFAGPRGAKGRSLLGAMRAFTDSVAASRGAL